MEEDNLRVWAVQIKGQEQDANFGFNKYVWLTDKQAAKVIDKQNDDEQKNNMIMAGDVVFKIKDISSMRRLRISECRNFASFDRSIIPKALEEARAAGMIAENTAGKAKLDEMKKNLLGSKHYDI